MAFIDLENSYDTIDLHGLWQILYKNVCSWRKIVESGAEFVCR